MRPGRRPGSSATVLLTAALLLVAGPACGDDEDPRAGTTTTTDPPPTTTTPTPEAQVEAAYLEFVEVVNRLGQTAPNPDDPDLARVATEPVLSSVRDSLAILRAENHVWERGVSTSNAVQSVTLESPDSAVLHDCLVENDVLRDRDDGSVVRTQPLTTRLLKVRLSLIDGRWVVASVETVQKSDGQVRCQP